jgi:hypothetical protein
MTKPSLYATSDMERLGIRLAVLLISIAKRLVVFRKTVELLETAIATELHYMERGTTND